ncbi:MAG: hypothetical protein HY271_17425 [Deltaproteobacteria bacterium]|nr:hypothetical protein [Deltaproteobacteria bacterium]
MVEHSDVYIVGRLIERLRLLIAVSEEIPTETKLQTQGILKMLQAEVADPEEEHDQARVRAHYALLYDDLEPYADLEALLSAMRTFISYL